MHSFKKLIAIISAATFLSFAGSAFAQERTVTIPKARGFDGVITQCVSFVRMDFANAMCDRFMGQVAQLAGANGLKTLHLGRAEWGFGKDDYLPTPTDTGISNPVRLTAYIRATDNPVSAFLWLSLYQEINDGPRPGRLVIWEDSGIGSGNPRTITHGLADGLAQKMQPVFQTLGVASKL